MDKFLKNNNLDDEFDFVVNNSKLNSKQTKINNNKKKTKEKNIIQNMLGKQLILSNKKKIGLYFFYII